MFSNFQRHSVELYQVPRVDAHCRWHVSTWCPPKFYAQQPESLLIIAAKQPGQRAKKRNKGVVYALQTAQRLCNSWMINTVHDCIQNGTPVPPPKKQVDAYLNQCLIYKSTKGSKTVRPIYDWMIIKFNTGLFPCQLCCCGAWWLHFCERSAFSCTKHSNTYYGEINFISRVELVLRVYKRFA
jgi:hypothetical protein